MSKKLEIHWSDDFTGDLKRTDYRAASDLCAAIILFADTGRGDIRVVTTEDGEDQARIYAAGLYAHVAFDDRAPTLSVLRAFSIGRPSLRLVSSAPLLDEPKREDDDRD